MGFTTICSVEEWIHVSLGIEHAPTDERMTGFGEPLSLVGREAVRIPDSTI
jgi:hypothetical protein